MDTELNHYFTSTVYLLNINQDVNTFSNNAIAHTNLPHYPAQVHAKSSSCACQLTPFPRVETVEAIYPPCSRPHNNDEKEVRRFFGMRLAHGKYQCYLSRSSYISPFSSHSISSKCSFIYSNNSISLQPHLDIRETSSINNITIL